MILADTPSELLSTVRGWRNKGETIGFVPTMGFFHDGHLALMRNATRKTDHTVVSIFVNPRQFGPHEDLDKYPRDLARDAELARKAGVDILFLPAVNVMYPDGYQTNISVPKLSQGMCGDSRPNHFDGVATVVTKLFNLVKPDIAVFGEKDYQQLTIIRQLTRDLNFNIEIVGHPIVREDDGLAMSSRNKYLSESERRDAPCLYRALKHSSEVVAKKKQCSALQIQAEVEKIVESTDGFAIDYIGIVDQKSLTPVDLVTSGNLLALAVFVNNKVRLIDNIIL